METSKKMRTLFAVLTAVFTLAALSYAGRCDYNEEVLYGMDDSTYRAVYEYLGGEPSESAIVDEYMSRREYWDGFKDMNRCEAR